MAGTNVQELMTFLDHAASKSIIPEATANSRKNACRHLLEILDEGERTIEFLDSNLDTVFNRFVIRNRLKFKGGSMTVYQSRVRSTIDNFKSWCEDPSAWEASLANKQKVKVRPDKVDRKQENAESTKQKEENPPSEGNASDSRRVLGLRLRENFEAKFEIPIDGISRAELMRIGILMLSHCKDLPSDPSWGMGSWPVPAKFEQGPSH